MKNIQLKKINISNFKGIKKLTINFNDTTNIYGANATGKTSIFDAFTWLLFGKDSHDRKDFDIKPLDSDGNILQKTENEVECELICDDETIILKRIHREKWVKKRGFPEPEFTGNETIYFWNEVPMNAKEYQTKINDLLDETIFKLISNPLAFNNLKWQDRRNVLIDIAGDTNPDYTGNGLSHILQLTEKKTIAELKSEISAKVKKTKEELKQIPTRIDEVQKSKPVPLLFRELEEELLKQENRLKEIDQQLQDVSKQNQSYLDNKTAIQNNIFELKTEISTIENDLRNQANTQTGVDTSKIEGLKQQLSNYNTSILSSERSLHLMENEISSKNKQIESIDFDMSRLRENWQSINAETLSFDESAFHCPACKREFESGDVEAKKDELTTNFNTSKKNRLDAITQKASSLKVEKESLEESIKQLNERLANGKIYVEKTKSEIESIQSSINLEEEVLKSADTKSADDVLTELILKHPKYDSLKVELTSKEKELNEIQPINKDELNAEKSAIQNEIKIINEKLGVKNQITVANNRIKELEEEESKLSNSLLELEKQQFDIENFIKIGIESLENTINNRFSFVKFKLFETQINGGQVECCDALIDGVPFHSANTASKINAGIDIINTLCKFYNVNAPIFIDNRESISDLIETNSQLINLIVSPENKELLIA